MLYSVFAQTITILQYTQILKPAVERYDSDLKFQFFNSYFCESQKWVSPETVKY